MDEADKTRWVFKLRPGVKFHDGSDFTADAVVWNVRKVLDREAPQFDPRQVGLTATRMPALRRAEKVDDLTVALITSEPDSFLPINLTNLFMASPAQWEKLRAGLPSAEAAWNAFAAAPSGTGAFRMTRLVPRERAEYTVRLHFSENEQRRAGARAFNVSINGVQVLANFDVFAATGAQFKATVRTFTATGTASGTLVIAFTGVTSNQGPIVNGIEILK